MTKNFQNLMDNINLHIQEAQGTPDKINLKRSSCRHVIGKMLTAKDKEKLESSKKNQHIMFKDPW